jgi:hypothetical protein
MTGNGYFEFYLPNRFSGRSRIGTFFMQLPCSTRWPTATAEIRNAINRVPSNMVVICEETLKNVKEERGSSMKSILIWLMRQLRLLNKDEIAAAVGLAEAGLVTQICSKALVEQWSQSVTLGGQVQALEVSRFTTFPLKTTWRQSSWDPSNHKNRKPHGLCSRVRM